MKIHFTGLLLLITLFLLSACGLKGPLYIENAAVSEAAVSNIENKESAEKKDNKEDDDVKSEKKD